jgi:integrase
MSATIKKVDSGVYVHTLTDIIYVGAMDGGKFKYRSTKMQNNKKNLAYAKRHHKELFKEALGKVEMEKKSLTLGEYGSASIAKGLKQVSLKDGSIGKMGRTKENQKDIESKFSRYIIGHFGSKPISQIKVSDINSWQNQLLKKLSPSSVKKIKSILSKIFFEAVGDDIISKNPCDYSESFEVFHEEQEFYTPHEIAIILNNANGWLKVFLQLSFLNSLRPSETMGLLWDDVNFERGTIDMQRALHRGKISTTLSDKHIEILSKYFKKEEINVYRESGTKGHKRVLSLTHDTLKGLKELKFISKGDFIFCNRQNKPFSESKAIVNTYFKPLLEQVGVRYKKLYGARHSHFTIAEDLALDVESVGIHSQGSNVAKRHYVHKLEDGEKVERNRDIATQIENHIKGVII